LIACNATKPVIVKEALLKPGGECAQKKTCGASISKEITTAVKNLQKEPILEKQKHCIHF
jgi:hypothetical protein